MLEPFTSPANPVVKEVRRAVSKGTATSDGLWIAEGLHLLEEARRSGLETPVVLVAESARNPEAIRGLAGKARVMRLADPVFREVASTETSQGVITLVRPRAWALDDVFGEQSLVIVLDGVQDPGNAGAIARAAEAFGATGMVFLKGTTGPQQPKTLRASAGSLFRMPLVAGVTAGEALELLEMRRVAIYGAVPFAPGVQRAGEADLRQPCAIAIGSEGAGLGPQLRPVVRGITIPTKGVESLNAAVSAAVLLYEASRQREHV